MVYNYTYSKHNETLLDGLSAQRQNQSHFCDITIKTRDDLQNEVIIFGHKCVLATTSDHLNSIINMEENFNSLISILFGILLIIFGKILVKTQITGSLWILRPVSSRMVIDGVNKLMRLLADFVKTEREPQ